MFTAEQVRQIMRPHVLDAVGRICHRSERTPDFVRESLAPILTAVAHLALEAAGVPGRRHGLLLGDVRKVRAVMAKIEAAAPDWNAKESAIHADRIIGLVLGRFRK